MLRVAEQYAGTDTGRQRRANEDSLLARAPLFVVADGMGGAQAGEVASRLAIETFEGGLRDGAHPELELAELARAANAQIHELSHSNAEQAGMGTTLTAVYVGEREVAIAHVGDSRAYCLRGGQLMRLTDDHSLVDELMRQGRLTPEEAIEHPQRSVITRALGPEMAVEVDTRSFAARDGDIYLLCSDGLTTMLAEQEIESLMRAHAHLRDAGEALIAAANDAGGRDNITVVLVRLEEVALAHAHDSREVTLAHETPQPEDATIVGMPAVPPGDAVAGGGEPGASHNGAGARSETAPDARRRTPRSAAPSAAPAVRRKRFRRSGPFAFVLVVLVVLGSAAYLAFLSVYFVGTNDRGLVTLYNGLPYRLPGDLNLYTAEYVSGVSASTLSPERRRKLLDHTLRSESNAAAVIHGLELEGLE
jgi:PPM family protein phosphatase